MLRFAENPDVIFTQILDYAFEHAIDLMIRNHIEEQFDPDQWETQFQHASKVFSPRTAMTTVKELQKGHKDKSSLWELNDYHYCLLYDILEDFCAFKNDTARDSAIPIAIIDDIKIWEVDF